MKLSVALLRWYKSFNINYKNDGPPKVSRQARPWNAIDVGDELAVDYPFIEIPLETDITTVVGGNESGKSHLISAICKVLTGKGVKGGSFNQTDLCRYATVPQQDASRWPNIGVHFELDSTDKLQEALAIKAAVPSIAFAPEDIDNFTLVVGTKKSGFAAHLFINKTAPAIEVKAAELKALRECLPRVQFIEAEAALPDNLTLAELLSACDPNNTNASSRFSSALAQTAAELVASMALDPNGTLTPDQRTKIANVRDSLQAGRVGSSADAKLAAKLFTDILDISPAELSQVLNQPIEERGYSEYFLKQWNDKIFERLDLAHFWQQDDQASIELIYKDQTLYFDITDKTGATYTFKERSSGLRYFLSYYIQAKALERKGRDRHAMILMDEPDSFLSIIAQHNLLSVFESLVGKERAAGKAQLLYTTHSPFLINRNFPRRIRVVVKEEAEEGTQFHGRASSRRFEPVRSALGIDSAQTLFMGATNLVLEGLTDQYLINEVVRALATPDTSHEFLDLNSVVVVSADGAPNIEKVLSASQWGDEPVPATVVLVDNDEAGLQAIKDITGVTPGRKKLIQDDYCLRVDASLHASLSGRDVRTIEDLIPQQLYLKAFETYVRRWNTSVIEAAGSELSSALASLDVTLGNVAAAKEVARKVPGLSEDFDKLGVLEEFVATIRDPKPESQNQMTAFVATMKALYQRINDTVAKSKQGAAQRSLSTNVKRLIYEFVRVRENGCAVIDLQRHLQRLNRESKAPNGVGELLAAAVDVLERKLQIIVQSGQGTISGEAWAKWRRQLESIRRSPLSPPDIEVGTT